MTYETDTQKIIQKEISKNLKRTYGTLASEDVPDRFLNLLEDLKEQDEKLTKDS
jgi:hypothetical protein